MAKFNNFGTGFLNGRLVIVKSEISTAMYLYVSPVTIFTDSIAV